jgi:uncharacterized protein YlzI (FlbEa/FlbD family)
LKLTSSSGYTITVDPKKITEFGPHTNGGSFINVAGHRYVVKETVEEILDDRKNARTT